MMKPAKIENISFDEEDRMLFESEIDPILKAKAIQFSILPKLNVMLCEAIAKVRKIYGISVLEDYSTISTWPAFRAKRDNDLKYDYDSAYVGIGGTRKPVWKGFERQDYKDVKIVPFVLGFQLDKDAINVNLDFFRYPVKLSQDSYDKIYLFLGKYSEQIRTLLNSGQCSMWFGIDYDLMDSFEQILRKIFRSKKILQHQFLIFHFAKKPDQESLKFKIFQFALLYPIYDSLIRLSLGEEERFMELLEVFNSYIQTEEEEEEPEMEVPQNQLTEEQVRQIDKTIDGINVRPGLRWQVFERDDFRCVCCGASAQNGAILHVDHITPRSKGGKDELSNFQTLCHVCNIGKSNKSDRNLRERN